MGARLHSSCLCGEVSLAHTDPLKRTFRKAETSPQKQPDSAQADRFQFRQRHSDSSTDTEGAQWRTERKSAV